MTKSQLITNSQKEKKMEFKTKDEVVVVDETKTTVFEAKQVDPVYPCDGTGKAKTECSKRWMESLSDCA
jgi:hypothetical protein